ncbi:hypothetical protein Tco_0091844 [Tanacetum coccineum]
MPNTRSGASMTHDEVEELVNHRVAKEIKAREAAINLEPLNENMDEQEGGNGGNEGNGNGGNGGNGNGGKWRGKKKKNFCKWREWMGIGENEMENRIGSCLNYGVSCHGFESAHSRLLEGHCLNLVEHPQEDNSIANNLMDQKLKGYARSDKNKKGRRTTTGRQTIGSQTIFSSGKTLEARIWQELTRHETMKEKGMLGLSPTATSAGHPFDIDLLPVELGSFDVIISMYWLAKYHALIVCHEKVVHIPYEDEVLIFRGDNCDGGSKLNIISCTRTHKYIQKGCQVYLAQVTSKKAEDKSEEKRLEDVPIV